MTDEQINGAAHQAQGKTQKAFGKILGDQKLQVEGAYNDAKGRSLESYGKAIDALDRLVEKVPVDYQPRAREALGVARRKPLLTTLGVAGVGLLLAGMLGRRR